MDTGDGGTQPSCIEVTHIVPVGPVLDHLPVGDPEPVCRGGGEGLAGRRDNLDGFGVLAYLTNGAICRPDIVA